MKKTFLAFALATIAATASAHPLSTTHYHAADGRVVIGNQFFPRVVSSYETDDYGRQVRVTTTTQCIDINVNPMNNHMTCQQEETRVDRETTGNYNYNYNYNRDYDYDNYRPGYGIVTPIIIGNGFYRGYGDRGFYRGNDHHGRDHGNRGNDHRGGHNGHDRGHDRNGR